MISIFWCVLSAWLSAPQATGFDPRQVAWQPTLEDALRIARDENRPLLVAMNMDAESASERIVREQYKDPQFVAMTRRCVCIIGSLFRHTPRDHDDHGRRLACPRLGSVTCGEHIALEPILFDRFLKGDRIAPRHALIQPDGTKTFDLFLLFNLKDLEDQLRSAFDSAPPAPSEPTFLGSREESWRILFRHALEQPPEHRAPLLEQITDLALTMNLRSVAGAALRNALQDSREKPFEPFQPALPGLLPELATIDGLGSVTRTNLLAWRAMGETDSAQAVDVAFGVTLGVEIEAALEAEGGEVDLHAMLEHARRVRETIELSPKRSPPRPSIEELEAELRAALVAIAANRDDVDAQIRLAKVSRDLAREKIDAELTGADLLLADAEMFFNKAIERRPDDVSLMLDLAKNWFVAGRYQEEEQAALEAAGRLTALPQLEGCDTEVLARALCDSDERHEALRWIGDSAARLLWSRHGGDPKAEIAGIARGARAFLLAALSPRSDDVDWQSAASFFGALGMYRQEIAVLEEGLLRFQGSGALRQELNQACAWLCRPELAIDHARHLLERFPDSAECHWFLGYSMIVIGDWMRRRERPDDAIAVYEEAAAHFEESRAMNAEFTANSKYYEALTALSRGFAYLLAQRQKEAANCLVEGIAIDPQIVDVRDALDREAIDLLDGALEYRIGRMSPVDPVALMIELERADSGNSFWARSITDTLVREGLRSDGRGEPALGDQCFLRAIATAEHAFLIDTEDEESRTLLAQTERSYAQRMLERGAFDVARRHLAAAATLAGVDPPGVDAAPEQLEELALLLAETIGSARPRFRPGR